MNCPGHVQIFKHGLKIAIASCRCRVAEFGMRAPLRAVRRPARADARARLHPGRRAHLLHRGSARGRMPEDQRSDLSIYRDFGFEDVVVKLSTRPEKRVGADELWDQAEAAMSDVLEADRAPVGRRDQDRDQPGRGRLLRPEVRVRADATPSAATGSAARCRSISTCRSGSARSTSTPTARRRRR